MAENYLRCLKNRSAPGATRTHGTQIRNLVLYPPELRGHDWLLLSNFYEKSRFLLFAPKNLQILHGLRYKILDSGHKRPYNQNPFYSLIKSAFQGHV